MHRAASDVDEPVEDPAEFTPIDAKAIDRSARLSTPIIYEVLRREGEQEMERPLSSLWWSGVAAELSLSLSLLSQAVLQSHLPATPCGLWCRASATAWGSWSP